MVDVLWLRALGPVILFTCFCARVLAAEETTSLGKPINIPPSQYWDGKDGPWSTFRVEVGTPPQQIRVIPASSQSSTWLVLAEACGESSDQDCPETRGRTYNRNSSTTWEEYGSYELNTFLEERVGLEGHALYGFDRVGLGWMGDGLPTVDNLTIAGILTEDFYVGSLSMNPRPTNFTDFNNPIPSLIQHLRNASTPIPSSSWSYTAGAYNLAPKVFGSLVLGGYDSTRFKPNDVVFPFGADISLDFQVAIQSITTDLVGIPLLSTAIIAYIDTLVAEIWLPTRSCQLFEEAFGLVWDDETKLYLLDDSLHESLLDKNPTVSFKVGPQVTGDSVTIDLPYFNWYQTAMSAFVGNKSGLYFPLKRAANDTQYVLGRAFLQSAYLSADYERNTFNLSQALYPASSVSANILPILPPGGEPTTPAANDDPGDNTSEPRSKLSTGATVGIAIGGAALVAIVGAVIFILLRRKKARQEADAHELEDTKRRVHEVSAEEAKYEVGDALRHEVTGDTQQRVELETSGKYGIGVALRHEVSGDTHQRVELAENQKPSEMDGTQVIYEMAAGGVKTYAEMESEQPSHKKSPPTAMQTPRDSREAVSYMEDDDGAPLSPRNTGSRIM